MKGKLIVIEGGDGAGKETQLNLLRDALQKDNHAVTIFDFPRYEKLFGSLIGRALKGEFGDFLSLSPYLASMPYMLDRATAKEQLLAALEMGIVLSNRYTTSSIAFQGAKVSGEERKKLIETLEKAEYEEIGIPRPDAVIYLSVPVEISAKLITEKNARNYLDNKKSAVDMYEKNLEFQKKAQEIYKDLSKERKEWILIDCAPAGRLLSREEIHEMVYKAVRNFL